MNIREFRANLARTLDNVVQTGEPLPVTHYYKAHATVVPTTLWKEAEAALQRERNREEVTAH